MGWNTQWIVDLDATLAEAPQLAAAVTGWLVAEGVVSTLACTQRSYGDSELLLPGASAGQWSEFVRPDDGGLQGFEAVTGRTVYHTGDNGIQGLRCPLCARDHAVDDLPWGDAVSAWHAGQAADAMRCPACGAESGIVDWRFLDFEWGFGNLAFGFWNWSVSARLVKVVGEMLRHRVRLVHEHN
jgi:hypothetical protein